MRTRLVFACMDGQIEPSTNTRIVITMAEKYNNTKLAWFTWRHFMYTLQKYLEDPLSLHETMRQSLRLSPNSSRTDE